MVALERYRQVLALPGCRTLIILMFFARIPPAAAGITLTLHVAVGLGRGYGAAGLVGAAATIGIAVGAPLIGRVIDRYGLRPVIVVTTIGEALFWSTGSLLPYPALLICGFVGGIVVLPAMSIGRQAIAALVPDDQRRTAYSLDSVSTELCFMAGPALAVFLVAETSSRVAMLGLAGGVIAAGIGLYVINPAVRGENEAVVDGPRPARRSWLTGRFAGVLLIAGGAVFVLAGTEVSVVAQLRASDQVGWTGLVMTTWAAMSAMGGIIYGGIRRSLPQVTLMTLLGVCTIPVGLSDGPWWLLAIALVPCGLLCAPTVTATGEEVSRLAPVGVRGEAMGLQSSAFTLGAAAGAPVVGFVVDHSTPAWGFAAAGLGGALVAALAALLMRRPNEKRRAPADTVPVLAD